MTKLLTPMWTGCALMSNGALVARVGVTPLALVAVATRVYPLPTWAMPRSPNAAVPETRLTVVVPGRVPPLGLLPMATVTLPRKFLIVSPLAFSTVTWTGTPWPAVVVVGRPVKTATTGVPVAVNVAGLLLTAALALSDCPPGVVPDPSTHPSCAHPSACVWTTALSRAPPPAVTVNVTGSPTRFAGAGCEVGKPTRGSTGALGPLLAI